MRGWQPLGSLFFFAPFGQSKAIQDIMKLGMLLMMLLMMMMMMMLRANWKCHDMEYLAVKCYVCVCVGLKIQGPPSACPNVSCKKTGRRCRSLLLLEDPNSLMARAWEDFPEEWQFKNLWAAEWRNAKNIYIRINILYIYTVFLIRSYRV